MPTNDYMASRAETFLAYQKAKGDKADDTQGTEATQTQPDEGTADPIAQSADKPPVDETDTEETPPQGTEGEVEGTPEGTPDGELETAPETAPDEEGKPPEPPDLTELDDETISTLAEAYEDKLLSTERLQKRVEELVKEQVQRQGEDYRRQAQEQADVATLLRDGEEAVDGLLSIFQAAETELGKVTTEEDYTPEWKLDMGAVEGHLRTYGSAVLAEAEGRYHRAVDRVILDQLRTLPTLSDEQVTEIRTVLNTAERMRNDPNQGSAMAFGYSTDALFRFLLNGVREQAVANERSRIQSRGTVAKKVTDAVATKAAAAKLAAQRGDTAPKESPDAKTETTGAPSQELYEKLKREGRHAEAQRVVDAMSRAVSLSVR